MTHQHHSLAVICQHQTFLRSCNFVLKVKSRKIRAAAEVIGLVILSWSTETSDHKLPKPDRSQIPETLSCLERLDPNQAVTVRRNVLVESTDQFGRLKLLLNNMDWSELPITETPYNGTIEIWELFNTTPDTHPIHLHLVTFQILSRNAFTGDPNDNPTIIEPPLPIDPSETGWKDTVRANPGEVTRIIARFGPFTGIYPWHCHI